MQKRKPPLVNNWFAGSRRMFMVTSATDGGLCFNNRLVYSFLVGRAVMGKGATESEIAEATRLDQWRTVKKVVDALRVVGLVQQSDGQITASEPVGDTASWFAIRNEAADKWWDSGH